MFGLLAALQAWRTLKLVAAGIAAVVIAGLWFDGARLRGQVDRLETQNAQIVAEHNAAVLALKAAGDARLAAATRAIETAPPPRPRVVDAMRSAASGADPCRRVEDIDRRFLESLR